MKYSKPIIFIMFINVIIAFVLIFIGHKTRNLELVNNKLINEIDEKKMEININQSEFALHNDNDYLIKLYFLYNENIENKESSNLVSLSEFSKFQNKEIIIVGLK